MERPIFDLLVSGCFLRRRSLHCSCYRYALGLFLSTLVLPLSVIFALVMGRRLHILETSHQLLRMTEVQYDDNRPSHNATTWCPHSSGTIDHGAHSPSEVLVQPRSRSPPEQILADLATRSKSIIALHM